MCEIATREFADHGFQRVTMRSLAGKMGCSPMTPYRYFENKEAILAAARGQAFAGFVTELQTAFESENDALERIHVVARASVSYAVERPACYRIMFLLDQREFTDFPMADLAGAQAWQIIHELVKCAVADGVIEGDVLKIAHSVWVIVHGAVSLHIAGKLVLGLSVEEVCDELMSATLRGYQPKP